MATVKYSVQLDGSYYVEAVASGNRRTKSNILEVNVATLTINPPVWGSAVKDNVRQTALIVSGSVNNYNQGAGVSVAATLPNGDSARTFVNAGSNTTLRFSVPVFITKAGNMPARTLQVDVSMPNGVISGQADFPKLVGSAITSYDFDSDTLTVNWNGCYPISAIKLTQGDHVEQFAIAPYTDITTFPDLSELGFVNGAIELSSPPLTSYILDTFPKSWWEFTMSTFGYETLGSPVISYNANSRQLEWNEVEHATSYEVFLDDEKIGSVT